MRERYKSRAEVSLECRNCYQRMYIPALKVEPGIQCEYCGEIIQLTAGDYAAKQTMVLFALGRKDVKAD